MDRKTFEDKLSRLGNGKLEDGAEEFYNGFVGFRRFLGTKYRFRDGGSAFDYLIRQGLSDNSIEAEDFMRYLQFHAIIYDIEKEAGVVDSYVMIDSFPKEKRGILGYQVSRVIRENQ